MLTEQEVVLFRQKIYDFYHAHKRDFAWRKDITPYKIVVSEMMLQQTQTSRVVDKFDQWLLRFPDFATLACSSVRDVLFYWQGLGYNRRGLALHDFAKRIVVEFSESVPQDPELLKTFKNIGTNTAGSICAFAFNKPVTFIETNIRTVFMYEFFKGEKNIDDKQLLPLIKAMVDHENPREWYYALMDYGVYLKKELKFSNAASRHYVKQSKFIGSKRQVRGLVIKILSKAGMISFDELQELISLELPHNVYSIDGIIEDLREEGFLEKDETGSLSSVNFIKIIT